MKEGKCECTQLMSQVTCTWLVFKNTMYSSEARSQFWISYWIISCFLIIAAYLRAAHGLSPVSIQWIRKEPFIDHFSTFLSTSNVTERAGGECHSRWGPPAPPKLLRFASVFFFFIKPQISWHFDSFVLDVHKWTKISFKHSIRGKSFSIL